LRLHSLQSGLQPAEFDKILVPSANGFLQNLGNLANGLN
jgi:hypothetical protein